MWLLLNLEKIISAFKKLHFYFMFITQLQLMNN